VDNRRRQVFLVDLLRREIDAYGAGHTDVLTFAQGVFSLGESLVGTTTSPWVNRVFTATVGFESLLAGLLAEGRSEPTDIERGILRDLIRELRLVLNEDPGAAIPADETVTLYRPVGANELALIRESGNRRFPPRLPEQPIFYPVLNAEYAAQIARDWNSTSGPDYVGYVTRFRVRAAFLADYQVQTVGARVHQEYWIPAEDLDAFNDNIVGPIEVIAAFERGQARPPD
jgi:hypothetical protein